MNDSFKGETKQKPTPQEKLPFKERLYSKIKIPLKVLDGIIVLLVVAVVVCIFLGLQ